jgi:hypothetical protein
MFAAPVCLLLRTINPALVDEGLGFRIVPARSLL